MDAVQCRAMCAHDEREKQQVEGGMQKNKRCGGCGQVSLQDHPIFATRWTLAVRSWVKCVFHIHMRLGTNG